VVTTPCLESTLLKKAHAKLESVGAAIVEYLSRHYLQTNFACFRNFSGSGAVSFLSPRVVALAFYEIMALNNVLHAHIQAATFLPPNAKFKFAKMPLFSSMHVYVCVREISHE